MRRKRITRKYIFSDTVLLRKAEEVFLFMKRDAKYFALRGISDTYYTSYEATVTEFKAYVSDFDIRKTISESALDTKNAREIVSEMIREVRVAVLNSPLTHSANWKSFKFKNFTKLSNSKFYMFGRNVVNHATNNLHLFEEEANMPQFLEQLNEALSVFESLLIDTSINKGNRMSVRDMRVMLGNKLFLETSRMCRFGKLIFRKTDVGRYNDYLMPITKNKKVSE